MKPSVLFWPDYEYFSYTWKLFCCEWGAIGYTHARLWGKK